jgi:hypothetical protein
MQITFYIPQVQYESKKKIIPNKWFLSTHFDNFVCQPLVYIQ